VIRRKLERLDSKATNLDKGPVDAFTVIYQSGLARQISWQAQVEEAVRDESDEFWQMVIQKMYACSNHACTIRQQKKPSNIVLTELMLFLRCILTVLWIKLRAVIKDYYGL